MGLGMTTPGSLLETLYPDYAGSYNESMHILKFIELYTCLKGQFYSVSLKHFFKMLVV